MTSSLKFLMPLLAMAVAASAQSTGHSPTLRFMDEYVISFFEEYRSTTVGGLSGIDYDHTNDVYYLLSDDRSGIDPARFYKARIRIDESGIDTVEFLDVRSILRPDGSYYPNAATSPKESVDPEAIRFHPPSEKLYWVSEGERAVSNAASILVDPAINISATDGKFVKTIGLPSRFQMSSEKLGPRQNGALEGITFNESYDQLFVALEEPLLQDGPRASLSPQPPAFTRIVVFDIATGSHLKEYVYNLDPVAFPPKPTHGFMINGISEILWFSRNKVLVMERSFSIGRLPCTVKIFLADLDGATDVRNIDSLINTSFTPASKTLLLNLDSLGIYIDNLEGITFGPTLPNGHRTLIMIADNNFSPLEKMQVVLFEIIP